MTINQEIPKNHLSVAALHNVWVWFGLVSLFDGISTFVGYLMWIIVLIIVEE